MKNIVDAFNYAMSEIIDLKSDGFSINIIVPYDVKNGYWSLKKHTEYGIKHKRELLPLEMWREIIFEVKNENEANQVKELQINLIKRGIKFDSSVSIGSKIHFEFDWSFDYKKGTLDFERIKLTDVVINSALEYGLIKKKTNETLTKFLTDKTMSTNKHTQVVDFTNPNADKIISASTQPTMNNNKQSSLDYYITKSTEILGTEIIKQISRDDNERIARLDKQTKAMHKEEHRKTFNQGLMSNFQNFEDYYNETFGGNK